MYEKIRGKFLPCPPRDGRKLTKVATHIGNRVGDEDKGNNEKYGVC